MKTMKRLIAAMLVIMLAAAALPALAEGAKMFAPADVSGNTFTNDYITFTVDTDARLSAYKTAGGDRLIFGKSTGSGNYGNTSYTTISVNGSRTKYGSSLTTAPAFQGNTNYSAQTYNGVLVEQRLTPVMNDAGHESIIEWRYTYTNNGNSAANVGCRIMLDTCLEDDDEPAFRTPDGASYTNETSITSNVPRYWFAYTDNMSVQGSFGHDNLMPDTLQFADWRYETGFWFWSEEYGLWVTEWDYAVDTSHTFEDSAVAATWHETSLAPGETIEYVMYYGIGEVQQQQYGQLELTLNGDHSVIATPDETGYLPDPVSLIGILHNVGNAPAANAYERIELPEGLTLIGDATYNAGNIAVGGEATHTWNYTIDETSYEDRYFVITVYYGCDGQEEASAEWVLFVPGVSEPAEPIPPEIHVDHAELRERPEADARADLRFIFFVKFNDAFIEYEGVTYGPGEDFRIDSFYATLTVNEKSVNVPGKYIYEMYPEDMDPGFTFTAVVKGIKPANFSTLINALGTIEFTELATGEEFYNNTANEPFAAMVNRILN